MLGLGIGIKGLGISGLGFKGFRAQGLGVSGYRELIVRTLLLSILARRDALIDVEQRERREGGIWGLGFSGLGFRGLGFRVDKMLRPQSVTQKKGLGFRAEGFQANLPLPGSL